MGKGCIDYIHERNRELVRTFYSLLDGKRSVNAAIQLAANSPCSRFWCSPENAYKLILAYRKSGQLPKRELRRQMLSLIISRCNGNFSYANIEMVVLAPAPSFFIPFWTAKMAIYNHIKLSRQCKRKRLSLSS